MSQATTAKIATAPPLPPSTHTTVFNDILDALYSLHKGSSRPSYAVAGMAWINDTTPTACVLNLFDGTNDIPLLTYNASTHEITGLSALLDEDDMASDSAVLPPSQQSVKTYVAASANPSLLEFGNLNFTATVGSKALTVALKGTDGNDPSSSNVVTIPFRSATLTSGIVTRRTVTGALSVVLSSGSTLGFTAALAGRIYVWAIDNAGTVVLGLSRTADLFPEDKLVSTTAEGGAGAADSETVMYSTAAQTDKACRCIGYIEITTGATAGEWDNAPTKVQVMGPGVRRTGDIVQVQHAALNTLLGGATTMPLDNTIPQKTEGNEILTKAITPTSAINILDIQFSGFCTTITANGGIGVALFQDATNDALAAIGIGALGSYPYSVSLDHKMLAGTTSSTTFKIRAGGTANNIYFNGDSGSTQFFNGRAATCLKITEVFA